MKKTKRLLIIAGPTASGKSSIALKIAKKIDGEIISCDSAQVYRYMNIGTAKPNEQERKQVKHYLIDYIEPDKDYSAVRFKEDCDNAIKEIILKNKTPILCGGTGMYINAVLFDMNFGKTYKSEKIRENLLILAKNKGNQYLYDMLLQLDKDTAKNLHPNDIKRIIRAIEIYKVSGIKKSELFEDYKNKKRYDYYFATLNTDRKILYDRINKRTDKMIENGLAKEVKQLIDKGYSNCKSLQAIGYKELIQYYNQNCSFDEAVEKIKKNTRNYAKRQITWFKGVVDSVWYNTQDGEDNIISRIINNYYET